MYCAIVVCICTRVIVVLSLCANVFVSAARSFFFFSTSTNKNYTLCLWWRLFFVFDQKFVQTAKAQNFLPIATFFCLVRYVVYTTFVSFFSIIPSTSTKGRSLFAFVSSRVVAIGAKRLLVLAGKEVERLYTLFARQKKKAPSFLPPLLLLSSCDLFFFITTYELYSRGLLGLLLFCSFIAFSWFKPSSRRRREESSSLVDPFSLFHSHALSFITLKKQAPSRSVDRSLLQTEDTHNLFSYIF